MRILLAFVLASAAFAQSIPFPGPGRASVGGPVIALVAFKGAAQFANPVTTAAINTTGANFCVIGVSPASSISSFTGVSDSQGNTWTGLTPADNGSDTEAVIYYAKNVTTNASHTFSAAGIVLAIVAACFSNVNTTSPFSTQNGAFTAAATTVATGSITPGGNGALIVSMFGTCTAASSIAVDSGMTIIDTQPWVVGNNCGGALAYKVQTTAAAINPTWTYGTSQKLAAVIASFLP